MRFLVDAQLPPGLAQFLEERGYEAKAVRDVGLREAQERALQAQVGPQILWLRIGNSTNRVLYA